MNKQEEAEYKKALEIITAYPDAIKTIIKYHSIIEVNSEVINELGCINLTTELNKRTANILKQYYKNTLNLDINLFKFPIKLLEKINLSKLQLMSKCGTVSFSEIQSLINKHNPK